MDELETSATPQDGPARPFGLARLRLRFRDPMLDTMTELVGKVVIDAQDVRTVAREFLSA